MVKRLSTLLPLTRAPYEFFGVQLLKLDVPFHFHEFASTLIRGMPKATRFPIGDIVLVVPNGIQVM